MYQYLFDDNTTQKVNDSTNNSKSILELFQDVDKKYTFGNQTDAKLNLQKIDYVAPSQQEVQETAKNSLNNYKQNGIDSINSTYVTKNAQLDKSIQQVKDNTEKQKSELENAYAQAKQGAKNDAIKRGLARSSIIVNKLENYDNNMLNNLAVLSSEANDKIASLNLQKNSAELEKENALKAFDIEYAIKLQDKIDSLNKDISKTQESVIRYNNEIAEQEAKWNKELEKENNDRAIDMAEFVSRSGAFVIETLKRNEKYQLAREYFKSMDKQSAINELTNNSAYKENLGDVIYEKLLKELQNK